MSSKNGEFPHLYSTSIYAYTHGIVADTSVKENTSPGPPVDNGGGAEKQTPTTTASTPASQPSGPVDGGSEGWVVIAGGFCCL